MTQWSQGKTKWDPWITISYLNENTKTVNPWLKTITFPHCFTFRGDGKPYCINFTIGDKTSDFQIDTGASLSMMNKEDFDKFITGLLQKSVRTYHGEKVYIFDETSLNLDYKGEKFTSYSGHRSYWTTLYWQRLVWENQIQMVWGFFTKSRWAWKQLKFNSC